MKSTSAAGACRSDGGDPLHDSVRTEVDRVQNLDLLSSRPSDQGHAHLAVLDKVVAELNC